MYGISYHFFQHKVSSNSIANSDGNRQTRTAEITRHSSSPPRRGGGGGGGRRSIASAFLFIAALEHAILHWSVRKQPQRIEFEIKCS